MAQISVGKISEKQDPILTPKEKGNFFYGYIGGKILHYSSKGGSLKSFP